MVSLVTCGDEAEVLAPPQKVEDEEAIKRLIEKIRDGGGTARMLDQVIVKIRRKIEAAPAEPKYLLMVHGPGYRLEV